jgi:tRNA uridine 5-carbamoylmethylation protein Kti12
MKGIERLRTTISRKDDAKDSVIIVDDIMYYRSMRREIFTLARDSIISEFVVVWVNVPLEVAMSRNESRELLKRVGTEAMQRIHNAFEPPVESLIFDRVHLQIDNSSEHR